MSKQATTHTINVKQEPTTAALAEVVAMLIRAQEQGKEIVKKC